MTFQEMLTSIPKELHGEIIEMDAFLKVLRPLKFKRSVDKRKINYVSPEYGISYAIFCLTPDPTQAFGWYFLHDRESGDWYRKTDYFVETLKEIAKTDNQAAERLFYAINECTLCKGSPCSAIPYLYNGKEILACYGRIVLSLCHDDFINVRRFFNHLNTLLIEDK